MKKTNRTPIKTGLQRQQGVAAIMFAIMLPILLGFITLGIEAGRYMALKGQLRDAAEVAALMVSAHDSDADVDDDSNDLEEKNTIARAVVDNMVTDKDNLIVSVSRKKCNASAGNCDDFGDGHNFYQHQVIITSEHNRWFPDWTGDGLAFNKVTELENNITSRKHYGSGVDVVFVADFSSSMNHEWDDEDKILRLKSIVKKAATMLENNSSTYLNEEKNKIALVPFGYHVHRYDDQKKKYCETDMVYEIDEDNYEDIAFSKLDTFIENIFVRPYEDCDWESDDEKCSECKKNFKDSFYSMPLTADSVSFNENLSRMDPTKGTVPYQGILQAAKILDEGKNPSRLLIVLSDGSDYGKYEDLHNRLLNSEKLKKTYCEKIRSHLDSQTTESGRPVQSKIVVIGFGYDMDENPNLADCAGPGNIFEAKDGRHLEELILDLVSNSEEVGSLYYPKATTQNNKAAGIH